MTTVVLASGVRVYREGLVLLLQRDGRIEVVGMAASAPAAIHESLRLAPQAVLMDVELNDALAALRHIREHLPASKAVALNLADIEDALLQCAEAGIDGYVPREASIDDLVRVVTCAVNEELYCTPKVAAALLRRVATLASATQPASEIEALALTPREREIAALLAKGLSNKAIARQLCIQAATVKNHVHHVLAKLRSQSRLEAAARFRGLSSEDQDR